ncbi:PAS domain S-box-containing protein/diguanylate cyclase (GGDEF) domain-containing protein [Bryocella elongata]|uniref:PAS domain S-box-containing protein/diguanylate cyclase (GGDEF) domain-containing protein n=1 Tax=Bryocella elongata TaxID=863522 RepID=A0A1H5VW29_9BACT|nr:EAL domain-containing protein [Bryocella elongata]SEF91509.1 PAS domain S-box-containing protein/diguanylate cyclase (GGDEF) domain-containing protein [Bryocella elongata]
MQTELLDIIIIGCLVLLFAATYRTRATTMVRAWTVGWLLVLVHFTALLIHSHSAFGQRLVDTISLSALVACAAAFLLPAAPVEDWRRQAKLVAVAGVASMLGILLAVWGVVEPFPYYVALGVGEFAAVVYALRLRRSSGTAATAALLLTSAASSGWIVWTIVRGRHDIGISALLCEFFLYVAIAYMARFHRISGGSLAVSCGLVAWSAVFPVAEFCGHLGIANSISPEFWNVPKYFVAFGMILFLLEDEVRSASSASKHYQLLFEGNPQPMWIADPETLAIESVNNAAVKQYGFTHEEFCRMHVTGLFADRDDEADVLKSRALLADPEPKAHRRRDGSTFLAQATTRRIDSAGRTLALTLVEDITDRQQLHDRLLHQANHDLLTGLPNRAYLEQTLKQTLMHSQRYGRQSALLCLDVDRFKQINDTYGHAMGDICLQEVSRRISSRLRSIDMAARVGGEEFAVVLHEIAMPSDAQRVAADLLQTLHAPFRTGGFTIELTASIGIAVYPQDAMDAARLWRNADCAMYRAKRAGGNQFLCMSPEIGIETSEANELEILLRRALKGGGGLEMYFQPLYKTSGDLASMEALVRFHHPRLGMISPDRFIPIAEENGLIVPLGTWVLERVCVLLTEWRAQRLPLVPVAINVSSRQITRPDFAHMVVDMIQHFKLDPHMLGLEITETAMMRNVAEATRQVSMLASLGIAFSIDDFGTGYSSLGQIDKLPVQTLKIDRSFTQRLCRPNGTYSIVDAIISMAHSLGLEVVAEGVEDGDQLQRLRDLNCDVVQGYLLSRPIPASEVPGLLQNRSTLQAFLPERITTWVA